MEFTGTQIAEPSTSSLNDEIIFDEKQPMNVFKTENGKVLKQKVNDEWLLNITGEIYDECDQLIAQKINLIQDLKVKNEHIHQAVQNKSDIQLKLDADKAILQTNVIKCKEYFNRLKIILQHFICNEDFGKRNHQIKEEIYNYKLKEKDSTENYSNKINNSLQLIEFQNMHYIRSLHNMKTHFNEMNGQQIDLNDRIKAMREALNEMKNKPQLFEQEQKNMLDDLNDLMSEYAKLKERNDVYVQKYESEKLKHNNGINELKTGLQKDKERIRVLKLEQEKLQEEFNNENMRITEVQNKHSSLDTTFTEAEELLDLLKKEKNEYQRQLQQQKEILRDQHSSQLDNVQVLKDQFELVCDRNIDLKQNCAYDEDIIATLRNRIQESLENKASTENNLLHNKQKIQENQKSYEDIINKYTTKTDELRAEIEELVNTHVKLNSAVESREQEYEKYKNDMKEILNQYSESEANAKKTIENLNLNIESLKRNTEESSEEIINMKVEVEKKCKIIDGETDQKIKKILNGYEEMKKYSEGIARVENTKYLSNKKLLNESTRNKSNQIQELKITKRQLQKELDQSMSEISRLSTECEKYEKHNNEICHSKFSATMQITGIEKINKSNLSKPLTMTRNEGAQLLTESSDDAFHYTPEVTDIDKEWQKLRNEKINKMSQSVKSAVTPKKSSNKYDLSLKDSDSDMSESAKNESGELFVPVRQQSPMFKQPTIRRPARKAKKSKTYNSVY